MKLTANNYFSPKADMRYMSCSQFKSFLRCQAATMADKIGAVGQNAGNRILNEMRWCMMSNQSASWYSMCEYRDRCGHFPEEIPPDEIEQITPESTELMTSEQMHCCGAIVGHYGKDAQKIQAVQELAKLICELTRRKDQQGENYQSKLLDEIAGSIIMIEQMRRAHDITLEMLNVKIEEKLDRQLRRMSKKRWEEDEKAIGIDRR